MSSSGEVATPYLPTGLVATSASRTANPRADRNGAYDAKDQHPLLHDMRVISHNLRMACSIRQCSAADLARLLESAADPADARHHRERFRMQGAGLATYLVAWRGDEPVGRCTVLAASKYDMVRQIFAAFPEMNALEAGRRVRAQGQR